MVAAVQTSLPPAPFSAIDERGEPRFGAYAGTTGPVDLTALRGEYARGWFYRLAHLKKWRWVMVATPEVMAAFAIVDVSYAANGFLFAADLAAKRVLTDASALGIPGLTAEVGADPDEGGHERFRAFGLEMAVARERGTPSFRIAVRSKGLALAASLDATVAPRPLTVVAPIEGGVVNVTQKSVGLVAGGSLTAGGRRYSLDGGFGGFDYTHGLLARHTAWRWAFATGKTEDGRLAGFNLIAGFNEAGNRTESAVWVGGSMAPLSRVQFDFDPAATQSPWRIHSQDRRVDLTFEPVGEHREERNLIVADSHFVQAFGTFRGTIDAGSGPARVSAVPGVAEDQRITW
jgi:hypothetical protein